MNRYTFNPAILEQVRAEIERANAKHGDGPLADGVQTTAILAEELGEFAQACLKNEHEHAREELIQIAAVALNYLHGTGPHFSHK